MAKNNKLLNVTVDRQKWLRGEGDEGSYLLRKKDGKMCCLGFACIAEGILEANILNIQAPMCLDGYLGRMVKLVGESGTVNADGVADAMETNDSKSISDEARERLLIDMGKKFGVAFEFVN